MNGKKPEKSLLKQVFEASTVGIHLVLCTFAGLAIGYGLDLLLGTWFLKFVFLVFGVMAGFKEVIRMAKKMERESDKEDKEAR